MGERVIVFRKGGVEFVSDVIVSLVFIFDKIKIYSFFNYLEVGKIGS